MEGTQLDLFDPGEHVHTWTRTQGPIQTHSEITLPTGTRWCWGCDSWVSLYRDGRWLNWRESRDAGYSWRDEMKEVRRNG